MPAGNFVNDACIVLTTAGSAGEAESLAFALVERRLAACVNILPQVKSVYRWQGKVEQAGEWLLLIKTVTQNFAALRDAFAELHSYELPECILIPISDGSKPYLDWIVESTR